MAKRKQKMQERQPGSGWLYDNRHGMKVFIRVVFGFIWLVDGTMKFAPGMPNTFVQMIQNAGGGQPSWLMPWFNFWASAVSTNPAFWVYLVGTGEVLIGLGLIFGAMRKLAYIFGMLLSLVIWSIPEGFGGPYGPGSTDIGTGIVYAFVFLCLMLINVTYGTSKYSLDNILEKRISWWKRIAEFS